MANDWKTRLERQVKRLTSSGLYESSNEIHLFVSDPTNTKRHEVEELLHECPKINLNYTDKNYGEAYLALSKVDEIGKSSRDCKILYFHAKGVFNKYRNFATKEIDELKIRSEESWVDLMEYFLIDKWSCCVDKLNQNDTVGVSNCSDWWWGNFWWVTSDHIKKLTPFDQYYTDRWTAEAWLHCSHPELATIKFYEFRHMNYDPLYSYLPKYFYDECSSEISIEVTKADYGYFSEQRDEGKPVPFDDSITEDVTEKIKNLILQKSGRIDFEPWLAADGRDIAPGREKILRIKFRTNIDPENEYVISSFRDWKITL